ncbi:hypothetical protein [Streptomyces virginiae]
MVEEVGSSCHHKNKGCGLKLPHKPDECRKYARWSMGPKGKVTKNRDLWLRLSDLMNEPGSIKVTDEAIGKATSYPVTMIEYGLLDWYAMRSYREKEARRSAARKRPNYPIEPVEMDVADIAKSVKLGRNRLGPAQQCLAVMNLIVPVSAAHRGRSYYALSPYMGIVKSDAETHSSLLKLFPQPIFGDVAIVGGKCLPADYKWGPLSGVSGDGDSLGGAVD